MNINSKLNKLSKPALVNLVSTLYGMDTEIDELINRHLLTGDNNSSALTDLFNRQLDQLQRENDFVSYQNSYDFSLRLHSIKQDINTLLRDLDPEKALHMTERFLTLVDSIFERADDSNGDIGIVFQEAIDQWLDIASELRSDRPDAINWVDKVLYYFDNNDYGCFDNIIANSRYLLSEDELKQLAWRFESQARKAQTQHNNEQTYNFEAAHACIGIQSVAEALDDIALYEKSVLITSAQPNTLQMASIIQFALEINELERAEYWLKQPQWQEDKSRQKTLQNELLNLQGNMQQLKQNLLDDFLDSPSDFTLNAYWEIASSEEKKTIQTKVDKLAQASDNIEDAVSIFLIVGNIKQAANKVISHANDLDILYYTIVQEWAELFEVHQQTLASIICYRALLTDLLNRGYSKAYHHGADYFHKLLALDKVINDYQGFIDAQTFIKEIQEKHWRKRSFWAEADYPNK